MKNINSAMTSSLLKHSFGVGCLFVLCNSLVLAQAEQDSSPVEEASPLTEEQERLSKALEEFDDSLEQGQVTIDESFDSLTTRDIIRAQRKKAIQETKWDVNLRSYYLDRRHFDDSESEALALGGYIGFKTGYFFDRFALGATAFTSQRLYGPDDKGGTNLLAPIQQGYSVIGEVYGEYVFMDGITLEFGRKGFNTAFINESDTRMTPNTFQAAVFMGQRGGQNGTALWRFGAGYFDKIKENVSEKFISMATVAGAADGIERGVYAGGANVRTDIALGELSFGAIGYYSPDILNIFYTESQYTFPVGKNAFLQMSAQYIDQQSNGNDLAFGSAFSASQVGIKAELAIDNALFTTSWTSNSSDGDLQSPWGGIPSYNSVQVQDFNLAGVDSFLMRAAYEFKSLPGLSVYTLWVNGSQPDNPLEYAQDEYDFNIQWSPPAGSFKGFSVRLRYALVTQDNGGADMQDFRVIFNYNPASL